MSCCGNVELVRWAGVIWYGIPWPLRLRLARRWWPLTVRQLPGCGCIAALKDAAMVYWRASKGLAIAARARRRTFEQQQATAKELARLRAEWAPRLATLQRGGTA